MTVLDPEEDPDPDLAAELVTNGSLKVGLSSLRRIAVALLLRPDWFDGNPNPRPASFSSIIDDRRHSRLGTDCRGVSVTLAYSGLVSTRDANRRVDGLTGTRGDAGTGGSEGVVERLEDGRRVVEGVR